MKDGIQTAFWRHHAVYQTSREYFLHRYMCLRPVLKKRHPRATSSRYIPRLHKAVVPVPSNARWARLSFGLVVYLGEPCMEDFRASSEFVTMEVCVIVSFLVSVYLLSQSRFVYFSCTGLPATIVPHWLIPLPLSLDLQHREQGNCFQTRRAHNVGRSGQREVLFKHSQCRRVHKAIKALGGLKRQALSPLFSRDGQYWNI